MEVLDENGGTKTGPGRGGWERSALTLLEPGAEPPKESWTKKVQGGVLRVEIWGNGTQAAPYALRIAYRAHFPPGRFPTWEETQEALHEFLEDGAVFALPPFEVSAKGYQSFLEALEGPGWAIMPFLQAGARPGSEVTRKSQIILMGGPHGNA